ncbi:hypothetical protein BDV96DRAFT_185468 [Lophiotrema nucula]|uniref:Uncharacterized protein n=1 Tax=Lophiotrema nucula TaxID=690887 RepID=A0A6A5YWT4_9PLEO|nr:hypothetical protein BDV96DRAFT_185468 [Lophiotrema nucula]
MASLDSTESILIDVYFMVPTSELKLSFDSPETAAAYQQTNKEARIFKRDPKSVVLPKPEGLEYLREARSGLVVGFTKARSAKEWSDQIAIGAVYPDGDPPSKEVRIKRQWNPQKLDEKLSRTTSPERQKPLPMPPPTVPPPPVRERPDAREKSNLKATGSSNSIMKPRDILKMLNISGKLGKG